MRSLRYGSKRRHWRAAPQRRCPSINGSNGPPAKLCKVRLLRTLVIHPACSIQHFGLNFRVLCIVHKCRLCPVGFRQCHRLTFCSDEASRRHVGHLSKIWDQAGWSVSSAGDVNGDGIDDLIVGVPAGDDGGFNAGEAYVLYAGTGLANIDLTGLAADQGFIIQGDKRGDLAGRSVSSAGDVNGDGFDDLIVGVPAGDDGGFNAGEAYVIYGGAAGTENTLTVTQAGTDGVADNFTGNAGNDIFTGIGAITGGDHDVIDIVASNTAALASIAGNLKVRHRIQRHNPGRGINLKQRRICAREAELQRVAISIRRRGRIDSRGRVLGHRDGRSRGEHRGLIGASAIATPTRIPSACESGSTPYQSRNSSRHPTEQSDAKSLNDRIRARPYRQLRPVSHSFAAMTDNLEV